MAAAHHVLMVASENDALPGGKVGGIGDVVRDVAPVIAARGIEVSVVIPAYGTLASLPGARRIATLTFEFGGERQRAELVEVAGKVPREGVRHLVLDHPGFAACGPGHIYCDDPPARPFATDATKFALFSAAVVESLRAGAFGAVNVVHLHDWHGALVSVLLRHHPACIALRRLRRVYTIHNLALQGIRPLAGDPSSFESWFPELDCPRSVISDPRWPACVNPMAAGVRLADAVHAVSPSYAEEIVRPNSLQRHGFHGGEGLEGVLAGAREEGRLFGILNGCEYPRRARTGGATDWGELVELMRRELLRWAATAPSLASAHFIAQTRLAELSGRRPDTVVTSVSRITEQKLRLFREPAGDARPALHHILDRLEGHGIYLALGSGDAGYEQFLTETAGRWPNLVFLRGYSDSLARALYAQGDLFLMPSSFEPCGISQMLAMRDGQPCLVHHVGGLRDTVRDGVSGFAFTGNSVREQAEALVARFDDVLEMRQREPERYRRVRRAAKAKRFTWTDSVDAYLRDLYRFSPGTVAP